DPTTGDLYFGNDGGIWQLAGGIWTDINGNLATAQLNGIAANPANTNVILGGAQMNGVVLDNGTGTTWANVNNVLTGDSLSGGQVQYDPQNGQIAYAVGTDPSSQFSGLYKSTDGGRTFGAVPVLTLPFTPIATSPNASSPVPFAIDNVNTSR